MEQPQAKVFKVPKCDLKKKTEMSSQGLDPPELECLASWVIWVNEHNRQKTLEKETK